MFLLGIALCVFLDCLRLRVDRVPEFVDNLHKTINLIENHFPLPRVRKAEFKHDVAVTVRYNQDVASKQISTF